MERHKPIKTLVRPWLLRATIFSLLVVSVASTTPAWKDEITVEVYCQMTLKLMELSLQEWQERVSAIDQNADGRQKWTLKLEDITRRNQSRRDEVHRQYGMSPKDELRYVSEHAREIDSYLEENPEVKESIESLKRNINILIEQFEAVVNPRGEGAPQ